ncbi:MAG: type II toxin-antitoxin system HicB family antitoxin [Beijerinckiaceae bacterium]
MGLYIGIIHGNDTDGYGVSFPDLPGHITAGDTIDEAFVKGHELISLLCRHWREDTGEAMPKGRPIWEIRQSFAGDDFMEDAIAFAVSTEHNPFPLVAE